LQVTYPVQNSSSPACKLKFYMLTNKDDKNLFLGIKMVRVLGPRLTLLPILIGFLALAAIVATSFWLNTRTQTLFADVVTLRAVRAEAVDLRSALQTAESSQRGYLYTKNEVYLAPFAVAKTQALRQLKLLEEGLSDFPKLQGAGQRLSDVVDQKIAELNQTVALQQESRYVDALAVVKTNHGKSLMDEASVYISGIIRAAEERLIDRVAEQQKIAAQLKLVSILSALVILTVVGIVTLIVTNETGRLTAAQKEVMALNAGLEERVRQRTDDLGHANEQLSAAKDRAEALLSEVNHRVANSLTMVSTLVNMQANSVSDIAAKNALAETRDRIYAVSLVHRELYTTGDVRFVWLDDYLGGLLSHLKTSINDEQLEIMLKPQIARIKLRIDQSISLGVVLNEWVSNALKYAYPDRKGEIRIELKMMGENSAGLVVADDGVGINLRKKAIGTGFGTKIIGAMAISLAADIQYQQGNPGTIAKMTFPLEQFGENSPE
jgi:two-component sensor histidine kinase